MLDKIKTGLTNTFEKEVKYEDTAEYIGSGGLKVFSTPSLVTLFELTAKNLVDSLLPEKYSTVGIEISVKHLKATPIGQKVKCYVEITKIDGKKIYFKGTCNDEEGKIGEGTHIRYVIENEKFLAKLKKRSS